MDPIDIYIEYVVNYRIFRNLSSKKTGVKKRVSQCYSRPLLKMAKKVSGIIKGATK